MSQFNAPAYDIERPTGQCTFTGRTLEPGESYIATLIEVDESEEPEGKGGLGLKRLDVSWEQWQQDNRPENVFSFWKTVVAQPNEKKKLFVDDDVLMNLLRRLADTDQPRRLAFRFVLCLILMRKKYLRYDRTEKRTVENEDGESIEQEWWLVTPKLDLSKGPMGKWHDSEQFEVLDPRLDEQQVIDVTDQIGEILEAEL